MAKRIPSARTLIKKKYQEVSESDFIRGVIQGIPYVGGTLDTWFFSKARKVKEQRLTSFLKRLDSKYRELEEKKIDKRFIETEEFLYLLEIVLEKILREHREEKRELLAQALVNSTKTVNSDYGNKELIFRLISDLDPLHIHVLRDAYSHQEWDTAKIGNIDREKVEERLIQRGFSKTLISLAFNSLVSSGLIYRIDLQPIGGPVTKYKTNEIGEMVIKFLSDTKTAKEKRGG